MASQVAICFLASQICLCLGLEEYRGKDRISFWHRMPPNAPSSKLYFRHFCLSLSVFYLKIWCVMDLYHVIFDGTVLQSGFMLGVWFLLYFYFFSISLHSSLFLVRFMAMSGWKLVGLWCRKFTERARQTSGQIDLNFEGFLLLDECDIHLLIDCILYGVPF